MAEERAKIDAEIAKGRCPICHTVPDAWVRSAAGYDICAACAEDEDAEYDD